MWSGGLLAFLMVAIAVSLAVGARTIPLSDVLVALVAPTGTEADIVVREVRVPRTCVGLLAGAALGIAGTLMQGHTRNPLADPGILGVNAGAAFVVCVGIAALSVTALREQVWLGLFGALAASVIVFVLGGRSGRESAPLTLALVGTVVTAILGALTSAVLLLDSATIASFRFWTVGSIAGRGFEHIAVVAPFLLFGMVLAVVSAPTLNALALGAELAASLGNRLVLARIVGIGSVALLTASAVALAGPLLFVGLIAPHVARGIMGVDYRRIMPCAAIVGAITVTGADVLGRLVLHPSEVQVGVVAALLGGPLFIAFVRRRRLAAL